ncbi:hypothetical protein [Dehalobacter sp. TeCB1]|jgi:hypothetical protein|uniref:hypothetical protein n=1 Tax=Dehalobacter sp. TeCB1 TaxID=1843715 RepID=UPI0002E02C9E|nr:hypothetical protein [Dehalobacter sp. TeCB1]OCZ49423.1 hypothetical protein A7D23_02915 [Dehalobacter sp. TeCB1]
MGYGGSIPGSNVQIYPTEYDARIWLKGDGTTDNAALFTQMISNLPDYARVIFPGGGTYTISSSITITKPIIIDFNNATIKGTSSITTLIDVQANNVIIQNGMLDLNLIASNGIKCTSTSSAYRSKLIVDNLTIKNVKLSAAADSTGGIYVTYCNGVYISRYNFIDMNNSTTNASDSTAALAAIRAISVNDLFIDKVKMTNVGIGVSIFGYDESNPSTNIRFTDISMTTVRNNGYYIQNYTTNVTIRGGKIDAVTDNGIVISTYSNYSTGVTQSMININGINFANTAGRAIMLRKGSGIEISGCLFQSCGGCISIITQEHQLLEHPKNEEGGAAKLCSFATPPFLFINTC